MDEYKAIEDIDDLVNGKILINDHGELLEKIRILLKLAKAQIGYCDACRIRYDDDLK